MIEQRRNIPRLVTRIVAMTAVAVAATGGAVLGPAHADPTVVPGSQVGAALPASAVTALPTTPLPRATQVPGRCSYTFDVAPPSSIKHVAPCGSISGTGSASQPWRTLRQAFAALQPGDVLYVHDDPSKGVDYAENNLTPGRGGLGAPCATGSSVPQRIRVVGAPGEGRPTVAEPPGAADGAAVLRIDRPWWLVEGLRILGTGVSAHSVVSVQAGCTVLRDIEITDAGSANAGITFFNATNSALLNSHIWESVTGDAVTGRPALVPPAGSVRDHHGVTVSGSSDRLLIQGNHSYGHNGDSIQCGEAAGTSDPTNLTISGNRYHEDEENAVDIKHCVGVTISGNKFFGYYPARPLAMTRSPQGDAVVVHSSSRGAAARVLIEGNRMFNNSRGINVGDGVAVVVIRRNLVFSARTDWCGLGAGIRASASRVEIYHNTLDMVPVSPVAPGVDCSAWTPSSSDRSPLRITALTTSPKPVVWNNIVARSPYAPIPSLTSTSLDSRTNFVGDPQFVDNPASNDYYTKPGSPARDAATPVPASLGDPVDYCDDPTDADAVHEPDIGFLESCSP